MPTLLSLQYKTIDHKHEYMIQPEVITKFKQCSVFTL